MNAKSLVIFLAIAGAVVWFVTKDEKPPAKTESLTAGQQKQMEKASNVEQDLQKSLDQRMQSAPANPLKD